MKFPLYIVAKDDLHIHVITTSNEVGGMEKVDIENRIYFGWDYDGYPFKVLWDDKVGIKFETTSDERQPDEMQQAIFRYIDKYSAYYRPDKPFIYDKLSKNYIGIINAMKKHIKHAPLKLKIINFFRRF